MLKVGLTGGIGCGKSTAVKRFRELGVPVIDADIVAREVVAPGQSALREIVTCFGEQALLADGSLNRSWLRQTIFADRQALQQLESILHPRIRTEIVQRMAECGDVAYAIVDVPLLFEKSYRQLFDRVLVIDCLPQQQRERVVLRDGSDVELVDSIMQSQVSREQRLQQADEILENSSSILDFYNKIDSLHKEYTKFIDT
ncbi:MAG TPA: dephospho-CoA kinase [Candidatus Thiothrix moscowensis]|uniref:dephospho-CoA kinase n=1 Tax=unclassified Thiothrix TaxID=2636184 RepID=UPI0025F755C9|nr:MULTISPECIES: dephospho-CoA kinase [unclassified Thiothrix]HRJ51169.1 dephospho-CoA kinase [Candidatus Thiothrix moscowensis]HRJ91776.1 dephospho-CoA kinase [Candidatus Thiothrix moscowensis]